MADLNKLFLRLTDFVQRQPDYKAPLYERRIIGESYSKSEEIVFLLDPRITIKLINWRSNNYLALADPYKLNEGGGRRSYRRSRGYGAEQRFRVFAGDYAEYPSLHRAVLAYAAKSAEAKAKRDDEEAASAQERRRVLAARAKLVDEVLGRLPAGYRMTADDLPHSLQNTGRFSITTQHGLAIVLTGKPGDLQIAHIGKQYAARPLTGEEIARLVQALDSIESLRRETP